MVTDSTNSRQPNNIVGQSDYQAALDGLEQFYSTEQHKNVLAKASHASLKHNLTRMVQVISDKDFKDHVEQYHYVQEEEDRDDEAFDHRKDVVEKEVVHDGYNLMEEEEEYESEDLLDPQALEEAQKLREQVRQMAKRVKDLRDSVLQRALRMSSSAKNKIDDVVDVRPKFVIPQELLASMPTSTSIQALMKVLNHSQLADLPKKMQLFQATLETIQKETKEDRSLSQTEAAILAREEQTKDVRELFAVEATIDETPQDRLANFILMQD